MEAQRKQLIGEVVSDKMEKTVVVVVRAHPPASPVREGDPGEQAATRPTTRTISAAIGDQVRIVESRPYSKDKHFQVAEILNRAAQIDTAPLQAEKLEVSHDSTGKQAQGRR